MTSADSDRAGITIYLEHCPVDDRRDSRHAEYGGDAELASDDRSVTLHGSGVAHHSGGGEKERCPGGVGDRTNKDLAWLEATWIVRIVDHASGAGCAPATDGDTREDGAGSRGRRLGVAA